MKITPKIIPRPYALGMVSVFFLFFMTHYFFVNCTQNHTITSNYFFYHFWYHILIYHFYNFWWHSLLTKRTFSTWWLSSNHKFSCLISKEINLSSSLQTLFGFWCICFMTQSLLLIALEIILITNKGTCNPPSIHWYYTHDNIWWIMHTLIFNVTSLSNFV